MQYLIQKKFPKDIADLISEYLPQNPMKAKIMHWSISRSSRTHFNKWYFNGLRYKDFKNKRVSDDFWFKCMNENGYTNEQAVKLRYKNKLEKAELIEELTALNLTIHDVRQVCHFGTFNRYGRMMEAYYKDKLIIF
jgi:hypothetical protein